MKQDFKSKQQAEFQHRCIRFLFASFLWSTHTFGWSIWPAEMLFWLKSHCYYVTLGCVKSACPSPHLSEKEQADRRAVDVQSRPLVFSEGESEISPGESGEEVKDSWKTKSWICSPLLPHKCPAFLSLFRLSCPHLVLTSLSWTHQQNLEAEQQKCRKLKLVLWHDCHLQEVTFKGPLG